MTPKTKILFPIILLFLGINSVFSQIDMGILQDFVFFTGAGDIKNTSTPGEFPGGDMGIAGGAGTFVGFDSVVIDGDFHKENSVTAQAYSDLLSLIYQIDNTPATVVNHVPTFGLGGAGETLFPGVYYIAGPATIGGTLILDAQGDPSSEFIFQIGAALNGGAPTKIILAGCAQASNVYWLAGGAIWMGAGAEVSGNLISRAGAVGFDAQGTLVGTMITTAGEIFLGVGNKSQNTYPIIDSVTQPTCSQAGSFQIRNFDNSIREQYSLDPGWGVTISETGWVTTTYPAEYTLLFPSGNGCPDGQSGVVIMEPVKNYWLENTSSDWNIDENWTCGVPRLNEWINIIPVIAAQYPYPIISVTGDVGWGAPTLDGLAKNLEIEESATCTVDNLSLRLTTILTLDGEIYLEGEGQLLQDTGSVLVGDGSLEVTQQGTGNSFRYNYWSSPVNSRGTDFTIGEVLRDGTDLDDIKVIDFGADYTYADGVPSSAIKLSSYWMYKLEDSGLGYSAWYNVGNTEEVKIGQGYSMKGSNTIEDEQNYTFEGKPNNGVIELTVNANNLHLVGNPYPSAIDAKKFIPDNESTTGAIYYWEHYGGDTHLLSGYQGGYATYNISGGTPASSNPRVSALGASEKGAPKQYIPVGQGFFVVGDPNGGQIQFNNNQRVFIKESHGNSIFMRTENSKTTTSNNSGNDLRPKFRIGFDAPQISHRQILLTLDENTTDRVDFGYDAEMIQVFDDDMYWVIDDKKYVIQATNEFGHDKEIPLGIQTKKGGLIRIKIDELENAEEYPFLYIKDSLTGETHDITNQDFEINLEAGEYLNRFFIVTQATLNITEELTLLDGVQVYMNNSISELQLNRLVDTEILNVSVFNYLGQQVKTWSINTDEPFISLPLKIVTGAYIVKVETTNGNINKKIIIIN
jgi:hypothetical protein